MLRTPAIFGSHDRQAMFLGKRNDEGICSAGAAPRGLHGQYAMVFLHELDDLSRKCPRLRIASHNVVVRCKPVL